MKKILILSFGLIIISCKKENASDRISESNVVETNSNALGISAIKFDKVEHDFGDVKKGNQTETEFVITNTGDSDLVIIDAHASCGCTVPEYPKMPIKPGSSEKIKVAFNANSVGVQQKTITIKANTSTGEETLRIKANVLE